MRTRKDYTRIEVSYVSKNAITLGVTLDCAYEHDHMDDGPCCFDYTPSGSLFLNVEKAEALVAALQEAITEAKATGGK